jgi:hypothetical protein
MNKLQNPRLYSLSSFALTYEIASHILYVRPKGTLQNMGVSFEMNESEWKRLRSKAPASPQRSGAK